MDLLSRPRELLKKHTEWSVCDGDSAELALVTLWTTNNKPSSVFISSTRGADDIKSLNALVMCLSVACPRIELHLLSSFWKSYYETPKLNDDVLEHFCSKENKWGVVSLENYEIPI